MNMEAGVPAGAGVPARAGVPATLRKFHAPGIREGSVSVIIGRRETGKTWLVNDILRQKTFDTPFCTLISSRGSRVEAADRRFDLTPFGSIVRHDEYSEDAAKWACHRQKTIAHEHPDMDPRACLVIDDSLFDNSWLRDDENLRAMLVAGKDMHLTTFITMSYGIQAPAELLSRAVDYVFLFRESLLADRKRMYDAYTFGAFPSFEAFCQVLDQCTQEPHGCMVIDTRVASNDLEDRVFWYMAPPPPLACTI